MSRPVKIFTAQVKDKLGWDFPAALVAIRFARELSEISYLSEDLRSDYVSGLNSHVIKYEGNYWGTKQMQADGCESRPLAHFVDVDEEVLYEVNKEGEYLLDDKGAEIPTGEVVPAHKVWTDKFTVDLSHLQSVQVLNSSMPPEDKLFRLIELDVLRRFK